MERQPSVMTYSPPTKPPAERKSRLNYRRYWFTLYRRDVGTAAHIVEDALAHAGPRRIYHRLFHPALALSGTLFARGAIGFCDEHFVTHHTLRLMRRVRHAMLAERPPREAPPVAALGIAVGGHSVGLQMVCDCLEWGHWRVRLLDTPERGLMRAAVQEQEPRAVLISIGLERGVPPAKRLIEELRRMNYPGVVAVGGRMVMSRPELVQALGADLTAPNGTVLLRRFQQMGIR
jgi:methanogenic corrinoid protein MtbC1